MQGQEEAKLWYFRHHARPDLTVPCVPVIYTYTHASMVGWEYSLSYMVDGWDSRGNFNVNTTALMGEWMGGRTETDSSASSMKSIYYH